MKKVESFVKEAMEAYNLGSDQTKFRELRGRLVRAGFSEGVPSGSYSLALDLILNNVKSGAKMAKVATALGSSRVYCPRCNGAMSNVNLHVGSANHCPSCNVVIPI